MMVDSGIVWLRDLLGGLCDEAGLGDIGWSCAAVRLRIGELAARLEALGDDLVGRLAVEHALAAGVVGGVEPAQQPFELGVGPDGDAEHLGADPAIEALHHAIRLR